jgi:hypothetical protein
LHDAQSCVARIYGFASWAELRSYVEARSTSRNNQVGCCVGIGRLDDPSRVRPTFHQCVSSKLPRLEISDGLPRFNDNTIAHPGNRHRPSSPTLNRPNNLRRKTSDVDQSRRLLGATRQLIAKIADLV